MAKALTPVFRIARHTLLDEVRHKSFVVMFAVCAIGVFLVRGCFHGDYAVNGQPIDAATVVRALLKVTFHGIAAGVMVVAALLSMRIFRRDRNEGVQSCILSKPIARWQYVAGKCFGLWVITVLFMFVLHGIVFLITSVDVQALVPEYLVGSLLCSLNLLFVVVAVLLLSLLMPDIVAFLCVLGIGIVSFVGDGIAAASHSQMAQMMMQSGAGPQPDLTWWKAVYFAWPKLLALQQSAASLVGSEPFRGFDSLYPLCNVVLYVVVLGALLFLRFRTEDIG